MKNIQVKLTFQADTNAAKQQMASLQQQLSNLAATPIASAGTQKMRNELQQAANKAVELKVALHNATNVDTGKLNLNKFSQQLKQNKMTLTQYAQELAKLGPQGTQAFLQLTNSIRQAETPMVALTGKMKALTNTLMNTLRWQISSSLITGAVSTFTSIIDYSKELNESLNNIRIVTGKNIDQMSKFADEAQKSAKALSATTTEYTNASLIYYQQGLSDKEVKERTDTTIKLANAVGEEAQTVSEWMTAIWNNFDDGSKSMEYYADVLAKLGAATASSADEIAGGLEKFAAVAETTGLSYEYAAAALATITSETRQSEDVVGTALKTIFARIENLKLGETLEDGLNLGQYSAALEKVGVNILDANGNLKEMDIILDNIATQWNTLNNAEQVALAQSVAGIRQYNQFLALMANWDVMEKNVELARDSTGELEKQNLIYSQGIEGTTARVQNTLDEIKNTLLDENDLIPLLETANNFLGVVNDILDAFGGLPTILLAVTAILTKMYSTQIAGALTSAGGFLKSSAMMLVGKGGDLKGQMTQEAVTAGTSMVGQGEGFASLQESKNLKDSFSSQERLQEAQNSLNASTKQYLELLHQISEAKRQVAVDAAKEADQAEINVGKAVRQALGDEPTEEFSQTIGGLKDSAARSSLINRAEIQAENMMTQVPENQQRYGQIYGNTIEDLDKYGTLDQKQFNDYADAKQKVKDLQDTETKMDSWEKDKIEFEGLQEKEKQGKLKRKDKTRQTELKDKLGYDESTKELKNYNKEMQQLTKSQKNQTKAVQDATKKLDTYSEDISNISKEYDITDTELEKITKSTDEYGESVTNAADASRGANEAMINEQKELNAGLERGKGAMESFVSGFGTFAQGAMGLQMLTSGFDSLSSSIAEGNAGFSEWLSALTSISFGLTMIIPTITLLGKGLSKVIGLQRVKNLLASDELKNIPKLIALDKLQAEQQQKNGKKSIAISIAKAMAHVAEWFGKGPWGWIIAGISLAAIAALIGVAVSASADAKKAEAAKEAEAEAATENYDQTKEQANANKELYDSYMDLLDVYKESGTGQEDLAKAAQELTAAYGIEGAAIASLTGDYDALTESIEQARLAELKEVYAAGERKQTAKMEDFEEAMRGTDDDIAYKTDSDGYVVEFDYGASNADESEFIGTVSSYFAENKTQLEELGITWNETAGKIEAQDINDPQVMAKMYKVMSDIAADAAKNGVTADSEGLAKLRQMLASMGDVPEEMVNLVKEMTAYVAEMRIIQAENSKGQNINEVTTLSGYLELRQVILTDDEGNPLNPESDDYKEITKQLIANANVSEWEVIAQAAKEQADKAKKGIKLSDIEELYKNTDSIGARALAMVKVTEDMDAADIKLASQNYRIEASAAELESVAGKYEISAKAAETFSRTLQLSNEELKYNEELANRVAATTIKLNKAIETLTKTWDSNIEALSNAEFGTSEYAFALANIAEDFEKAFNVENENINLVNYINNNSKLIQDFMSGDLTNLRQLQRDVAEESSNYYDNLQSESREIDKLLEVAFSKDYQYGEQLDLSSLPLDALEAFAKENKGALTEILGNAGFELVSNMEGDITSITKTITEANWKKVFDEIAEEAEKRKLDPEEEIERYYEVNQSLEDIERYMNNIGKAKDRAFGNDKLAYIKEEKRLLDEQISTYDKKLNEIESHIDKDKAAVLKFGFDIDDQGNIVNYETTMRKLVDEYNKGIVSTDKATQEKVKEKYKEMEEALKQWNSTIEEYEQTRDDKTEAEYERLDKNLEEIRHDIEVTSEISERSLDDIDHQLNAIEDDAFRAAEAIALMGKKAEIAKNNSEANTKGIEKILDTKGISKDELINIAQNTSLSEEEKRQQLFALFGGKQLTDGEKEDLQNYVNSLWESNEAIREQYEAIQDQVISTYEKWNEELGYNIEMLERSQSMLESYRNIIDIIGKDTLGISNEIMDQMGQANVKMAQQSVEMARTRYETLKEAYNKATQEGSGVDEETRRELEATMLDAQQEFMDSWASSLEVAAAEFESSVERIMEAYDSAMGNLSEKSEWFEKQQTLQDFFLKDYEKTYEISKLNRQISQSIDSNDNVAAQRKLRDIQSELLDYQKQGKNMSDYDLQYLQKKYDLTMAQNALEDAQNAKSQARLTRDSSGNFGYVYTANQKNIESAQQQFEDKLYAMEQFLDKSQNDLSKQWFELNQQWADEMAALDKNAQDYKQKAADITAYYTELMNNVSGEMTDMVQYGMEINQEYGTHAAETFNETILGKMYTDYSTFQGLQATATEAMQTSLNNIISKHSEFKTNVETTMDKAGTSVEDFKDDYTTWMNEAEKANAKLVQNIKDTATKMKPAFDAVLEATRVFAGQYANELKPIEDANTELATSINDLITAYSILTGEDVQAMVDKARDETKGQGATGKDNTGTIFSGGEKEKEKPLMNNKTYVVKGTTQASRNSELYKNGQLYYELVDSSGNTVYTTGNYLRNSITGNSYVTSSMGPHLPDTATFDKNNSLTTVVTTIDGTKFVTKADLEKDPTLEKLNKLKSYSIARGTKFAEAEKYSSLDGEQENLPTTAVKYAGGYTPYDWLGDDRSGDSVEYLEYNAGVSIPSDKNIYFRFGAYSSHNYGQRVGIRYEHEKPVYLSMADTAKFFNLQIEDIETLLETGTIWQNGGDGEAGGKLSDKYSKKNWTKENAEEKLASLERLKAAGLIAFDTGGYTGSWGPEGRMAMLHQKEIVLNAHDTENLLTVVEIVRSITDKLNNNILLASQGLGGLVTAAAVTNNREVLEQNVTIHAEFPNATDHNEIELAFNDLINQASQYVNRR